MQPQFSSMLATLLVVIAGVTVLIMLEMNGKMKETQKKSVWVITHRILGYLFLILFAFMLVYMVIRAGSFHEELPAKAMLHIILALLLVPLIMIKVVIARRRAQLSTKLILLGMAIFGLSFGLTGITAGYYAFHRGDFKYTAFSGANKEILSIEHGQKIMNRKCSKCHSLERVYRTYKSDMAWAQTINKMATLDYPNITNSDLQQIVDYLSKQQEKRQVDADKEIGRNLVAQKCNICHGLDKVFGADLNKEEWNETINKMTKILGDPDFLSQHEQGSIIHFLTTRKRRSSDLQKDTTKMEAVRLLVARKCSVGCHALDRVLREAKNEVDWREPVNSMIEITGDPNFLSE
ncbi:MAG: hypothetical protein D3923_15395, partial [Candidatus Electrothrix sp. AR3]|nr:hypothetical protein [Candidatus Electrothrix sp. AR3]